MKYVISFCNKPIVGQLCEYDSETGETRCIKIGHPMVHETTGATGLAPYRDGFLVAVQSEPPLLCHLSRDYEVIASWPLSSVVDPHSVAVRGDVPYIASTGTNAIVRLEDGEETVHWSAECGDQEHLHVNSIAWHDDRLYLTAFGPRAGELWSSARAGYLLDVDARVPLMSPVYHPHSIVPTDEGFLLCESSRQRLACENGDALPIGGGYTRGLAVTPDEIIVGISRGRQKSRSTGAIVDNPADPGQLTDWCGVRRYSRGAAGIADCEVQQSICLQDYADEIYDILAL